MPQIARIRGAEAPDIRPVPTPKAPVLILRSSHPEPSNKRPYRTKCGQNAVRNRSERPGIPCNYSEYRAFRTAGQLTQRWTLSIWGPIAKILADPPPFSHKLLESPRKPRGRGPVPRLRTEQVDDLIQQYEAGKSATALARAFGINQQTALDHLHRRGIEVIRSPKAIDDDQLPKLRELYEGGLSLKQLGEIYGCSRTSVSAALTRDGVPTRQTWSVIPSAKVGELEELRSQGWTYQAIGERYGCSRWTVAKALQRTPS